MNRTILWWGIGLVCVVLSVLVVQYKIKNITVISGASIPQIGARTKEKDCRAMNGLPDKYCTPGAINPLVTQDTITSTICVDGYTKTVRPPVNVTTSIKISQMEAYGFTDSMKHYELDHLIPLEIGGAPGDVANLWPEASDPSPGYHEKDQVENYLHDQICNHGLLLATAQNEIAYNWVTIYQTLP